MHDAAQAITVVVAADGTDAISNVEVRHAPHAVLQALMRAQGLQACEEGLGLAQLARECKHVGVQVSLTADLVKDGRVEDHALHDFSPGRMGDGFAPFCRGSARTR